MSEPDHDFYCGQCQICNDEHDALRVFVTRIAERGYCSTSLPSPDNWALRLEREDEEVDQARRLLGLEIE